ncbi:hypothetical protein ACOMHN_053831 [Nucella lapillus]
MMDRSSRKLPELSGRDQKDKNKGNPWSITDNALRQLSNLSRQGPRKLQLPSVSAKTVKRVNLPSEDEEFHRMRFIRMLKSEEILAEWSGIENLAPIISHFFIDFIS